MGDLRCITLKQPYASLAAHGVKTWETRSWSTRWRGPVAIHAGKARLPKCPDCLGSGLTGMAGICGSCDGDGLLNLVHDLDDAPPLGAVVAVADLTDCTPIVGEDHDLNIEQPCIEVRPSGAVNAGLWLWLRGSDEDEAVDITDQLPLGHWNPGGWAWRLDNIRRLPQPIPTRGRQGLWTPDPDLAAAITEATS